MKKILIMGIRGYQKYLSPLKRQPCCRFRPTCSAYALEAFQKRGFFVGLILTVGRIFRCQPFCAGGYDPVPVRGLRNPKALVGAENEENDKTGGAFRGFSFDYELPLDSGSEFKSENEKKN